MGIQWGDEPAQARTIRIFRLKPGCSTLNGIYLLGSLTSVLLHYTGQGSLPCLGEECPHCPQDTFRRWYGPAAMPGGKPNPQNAGAYRLRPVILELNTMCARELIGRPLRGLHVYLSRAAGKTAPTVLRFPDEEVPKEIVLPPSFDVRPHLERIWDPETVQEPMEEIP